MTTAYTKDLTPPFPYARVGIPVFPLHPGSKVPATKHGSKTRHHRPTANPGPLAAASQPQHRPSLRRDIRRARRRHQRRPPRYESLDTAPPRRPTVGAWAAAITPTGGRHILFAPSGGGNHSDRASSGLDFRGAGGYIVGRPPHHRLAPAIDRQAPINGNSPTQRPATALQLVGRNGASPRPQAQTRAPTRIVPSATLADWSDSSPTPSRENGTTRCSGLRSGQPRKACRPMSY